MYTCLLVYYIRYEIKALLLLLLLVLSIGLRTETTLYSSADNLVEPTERTAAHSLHLVVLNRRYNKQINKGFKIAMPRQEKREIPRPYDKTERKFEVSDNWEDKGKRSRSGRRC